MQTDKFNKIFIGSGLISEILLHTLIHHKGESPEDFYILGKKTERCEQLMKKYNIRATTNLNAFISKAKVLVLAVDVCDIEDIPEIVEKIRDNVPPNILINSVTPNLKIAEIEKIFPNHPVMRLGLNLSAISGNNVGSFVCGKVNPADTEPVARFLMESFGTLIESKDEDEFEKIWKLIFAISCGNYLSFNCMIDSLIKQGLNPHQAREIVSSVQRGTAETFSKKYKDDILRRSFEYSDVFKAGLKLQYDYGIVQAVDDVTHLDENDLKDYLERVRNVITDFDEEVYEVHYKNLTN